MTNRRRSGKGKTSVSKKSESPTKKLNRRGRRSRKSESPEQPENAGSECSGEEVENSHKGIDGEDILERESCKDSSQFDLNKSNDDQKSQAKEEESGGSDGSWKVKSENGGGGGIPKLKLCLTRPPEMPSPTSEQNPSPRRKRRSGRGNATPTKEELIEENIVDESLKRVTRNQKIKESQSETVVEKEVEGREEKDFSPPNMTSNAEEDETRLAVESICNTQHNDDSQMSIAETLQEEIDNKDDKVKPDEKIDKSPVAKNFETPIEENLIPSVEKTAEGVMELIKENETQLSEVSSLEIKENKKTEIQQQEQQQQQQQQHAPSSLSPVQVESALSKPESETELEPVLEIMERRRSSSRDSSEERAKEAALRSRNKNKRKEGSEEGEVIESPGIEIIHQIESQEKIKKSPLVASSVGDGDSKENLEELAPTKSGARKRRWGSSTSRANKKPSVSISTDFLKEIIPEAKPLLMSEVQLSPNEEDEEGQLKDSEESLPIPTKKVEREKMLQSDESEKDYEEEAVESGMEEPGQTEMAKPTVQVKEKEFTTFTRKVSVMSSNEKLQKSPSPPRNKPSNILYIVNLVRPFTIPQLRELLARTGTIVEDGFWIDKIKSKCYVKYETEEQAKTTRHALHGVRWPVSNPKHLSVDFGSEVAMKAAVEGNEITTKRPIPSLFDKHIDLKTTEKAREREKERDRERERERERDRDRDRERERERERDRDRDRERDRDKSGDRREKSEKDKKDRSKHREDDKRDEGEEEKEKKSRPPVEPLVRDRTVRRVTMPIREWDVGKNEDGFSPPRDGVDFSRHSNDRYERRVEYDKDKRDDYDDRRRRDRDRNRRSVSGEPPRKSKKKTEEEAPAKLLDDLFRKTKATPCIYWLPLTPEQIAVKEEMRRKHMAEHEKKVAELKKMQREQNKRSSDKRRHRTKSRSRSRSAKK